jgi:hypothetical protein
VLVKFGDGSAGWYTTAPLQNSRKLVTEVEGHCHLICSSRGRSFRPGKIGLEQYCGLQTAFCVYNSVWIDASTPAGRLPTSNAWKMTNSRTLGSIVKLGIEKRSESG